jgi:hypothetical protein
MATPTTTHEMLKYFQRLNSEEQKTVLQIINKLLAGRGSEANTVSLKEYSDELEENDAEIESGEFMEHEEVIKRFLKP